MTVLLAPVGAAIAHRLTQRQLGTLFGAFLLLMSIRMVILTYLLLNYGQLILQHFLITFSKITKMEDLQ